MFHTFDTTAKHTSRRTQRQQLIGDMQLRSGLHWDDSDEIDNVNLHHGSLVSLADARQILQDDPLSPYDNNNDDDDGLDFGGNHAHEPLQRRQSDTLSRDQLSHPMDSGLDMNYNGNPGHGRFVIKMWAYYHYYGRVCATMTRRTYWLLFLVIVVVVVLVATLAGGRNSSEVSSSNEVLGALITTHLTKFEVLSVSDLENQDSPQRQSIEWVARWPLALELTRNNDFGDNWETDPLLRPLFELYGLHVLFLSTEGPKWRVNTNWKSSFNTCDYYGVTCTTVRGKDNANIDVVATITLNDNFLNGTVPGEIGLLHHLTALDLSSNGLMGDLPESIGHLSKLTTLNLAKNRFQNSIPETWDTLATLHSLQLHQNELRGPLSRPVFQQWSKLTTLSLYSNSLTGRIPDLGHMIGLKYVLLDANQFVGYIPSSLSNLPNLVEVRLRDNRLDGHLPLRWKSIANTKILDVAENDLSGPIPAAMMHLKVLDELYLNNNSFSGTISTFMGTLSRLQILSLGSNKFRGGIPSSLSKLTKLRVMRLEQIQLTGEIPTSLGTMRTLEELDFSANKLTGTLPSELGFLSNLGVMKLDDNVLNGPIPEQLSSLQQLSDLRIHHNELSGTMPVGLCSQSLEYLIADCGSQVECSCCSECF